MARFVLEVKQTGVWLHKGEYGAQRTALQGGRHRFPGLSIRITDRETGNVVFTLEVDQVQPVEDDGYGFATASSFMGMVDDDTRRFKNTEDWFQKLTQQRNVRIQRFQEERVRARQRRLDGVSFVPETLKVRKPHIKWNVDGF